MPVCCRLLCFILLVTFTPIWAQEGYKGIVSDYLSPRDSLQIIELIHKGEWLNDTRPDSARSMLLQALGESRKLYFKEGIMQSLLVLAMNAKKKQEYDKAWNYLEEARSFFPYSAQADSALFIRLLTYSGHIALDQGLYDKAAEYHYQVIRLYGTKKDSMAQKLLAANYGNLAEVFIRKADPGKAAYYLNLAAQIAERFKDSVGLAKILLNKGIVMYLENKMEDAHHLTDSAMVISRLTGEVNMIVKSYNNKASWFISEKKYAEAIPWLKLAMTLSDSIGNSIDHILATANLGYAYFNLKDYNLAEDYLLQTISLSERTGLKDGVVRSYEYIAQLYEQTGSPEKANEYLRKYIRFLEKDYINERQRITEELDMKYQSALKEKEISEKKMQIVEQDRRIERQKLTLWVTVSVAVVTILFVSLLFYQKNRLKNAQVRQMKQEKQISSLQNVMAGEELERKRIAEDLHDGIGGMLAALKMNFTAVQEAYNLSEAHPFKALFRMLDETSAEVRRTSHNLMPDMLQRYGLIKALGRYFDRIMQSSDIEISMQMLGEPVFYNKSFELALYRIFQEITQNVLKHARAHHIFIQVNQQDDVLSIMIEDDGVGFNTNDTVTGIGLENIKNRVRGFYGNISFQSEAGKGTLVYMEFDMHKINETD